MPSARPARFPLRRIHRHPVTPDPRIVNAWYRSAGVRRDERRMLDLAEDVRRESFPAHLVPHLMHPLVRDADPRVRRYLAGHHLFQYLRFTAHFETPVVNRAAERIANSRTGLDLPAHTRMDAFKIYVDEGYHALSSLDVQEQVSAEILVLRRQIAALERQLHGGKIRFTWADRAFLAALLHRLPHEVLDSVRLLVRPETVLRWHRDLIARRHAMSSRPTRVGRATHYPADPSASAASGPREHHVGIPQNPRRTGRTRCQGRRLDRLGDPPRLRQRRDSLRGVGLADGEKAASQGIDERLRSNHLTNTA